MDNDYVDPVASVASAPVGASEDPSAPDLAVPVALPLGVPSDPEADFRRQQQGRTTWRRTDLVWTHF